ncbi:sensor histidine kinase [Sulfuriferula nivalis]|uniref:histidine kinase n=1 Tax=Sulfuriferula nivalis TaxID=2675298 RepID=A0A809RRN1_9PROT|nr:ATP-binding protein [Sulfuriferula nivalis]BBP01531.1 sensor protein PilS [Sulfuriferula nivalis]
MSQVAFSPQLAANDRIARSWKSLHYLNLYRLIVAGVFLLSSILDSGQPMFGQTSTLVFTVYSGVYLAFAVLFAVIITLRRPAFNVQLNLQIVVDIVIILLMMAASGGVRSGLGLLLVVSIASSGLVAQGRIVMFHAALAAFGVLVIQTLNVLNAQQSVGEYAQAGLLGIVFFATAAVANVLSQRILASEELAKARAVDLENMAQINQLVIDDMQDGVVVLDSEGRIRQTNHRALSLLRHADAGSMGSGTGVLLTIPVLAEFLEAWRKNPWAEFPPIKLGSEGGYYLPRFIAVTDKRVMGAVLVLEDMTRTNEQAQQIKLAALGRLTANIAHEIRNPLAAISHATEILREDSQADKSQQRLLEIVLKNSQRINHLVTDVMALNRRDRAQLERINLNDFVTRLVDEFVHDQALSPALFHLYFIENAEICFDHAHLWQVMTNLILNAVRHSRKQAGSVRISILQVKNGVAIHVQDDGSGVSEANQVRLFEPFFTTESSGTGLGLYISKELCLANHANLDYVSGDGGHFRISCLEARC